jgi:hypothetical protein
MGTQIYHTGARMGTQHKTNSSLPLGRRDSLCRIWITIGCWGVKNTEVVQSSWVVSDKKMTLLRLTLNENKSSVNGISFGGTNAIETMAAAAVQKRHNQSNLTIVQHIYTIYTVRMGVTFEHYIACKWEQKFRLSHDGRVTGRSLEILIGQGATRDSL